MGMGQGIMTGLGHGGITCVLQTQFSNSFLCALLSVSTKVKSQPYRPAFYNNIYCVYLHDVQ